MVVVVVRGGREAGGRWVGGRGRGKEIVQIDEFREVVDVPWGLGGCDPCVVG